MLLRYLAFVTAGLLFAAPAAAKPTLVVAPLQSELEDARDARTLSRFLRTYAGQASGYTLVTPEDMGAIDEELKRQLSGGCSEASCIAEIGGALGAQFMITGSLDRLGRRYILNIKLIDIEQVKAITTLAIQARSTEAFADLLPQELNQLLGGNQQASNPASTQQTRLSRERKVIGHSLGFYGSPPRASMTVTGPHNYKATFKLGDPPLTNLQPGEYYWAANADNFIVHAGRLTVKQTSGPQTVAVRLKAKGVIKVALTADSTLHINGKQIKDWQGETYLSPGLNNGFYTVIISRPNFAPLQKRVLVSPESTTALSAGDMLMLGRLKIVGFDSKAKVRVTGPVSFTVDGQSPYTSKFLPNGTYTITAQSSDYLAWQAVVPVTNGNVTPVQIMMKTVKQAREQKQFMGKVVGGIALALGTGMGATNRFRVVRHEWSRGTAITSDILSVAGAAFLIWNW